MAKQNVTRLPVKQRESKSDESSCIVISGGRGIALAIVREGEQENLLAHAQHLTRAVAGMHRAIYVARSVGERTFADFSAEDLTAALAGTELVANLAAEMAAAVEERHG